MELLTILEKLLSLLATMLSKVEAHLQSLMVHPEKELRVFNAPAAFEVKRSPVKIPSAPLIKIILGNSGKNLLLRFHAATN